MFREYIRKLEELVGEDRTKFILANSIVLVVEGSNDISNTYFLSHAREVQYDIPTYTDLMVSSAASFLKVCTNLISVSANHAHLCISSLRIYAMNTLLMLF